MRRIYELVLHAHFLQYQQMAFLSGPRQVGKTTILEHYKNLSPYYKYLNWDISIDRALILGPVDELVAGLPIDALTSTSPIIAFDEIHKYKNWKSLLKGFSDEFKTKLHIIVTGSAKLNVFRRGGDSLMGRYFLYRIHPLSIAEILQIDLPEKLYRYPKKIESDQFDALFQFGGYPEPYLKGDKRFHTRWQNLRTEQMFREDIRELAQVQELAQLELLGYLLKEQATQLTNYSNLASKVRVSNPTIRRWLNVLESFYYCFTLQPYSKNVTRSLLKEPKVYLWDWSVIGDEGARVENFVAAHLLKAVHFWTDLGYGEFKLYFLRDKNKREVDFLVTQNEKPWLLLEVKKSAREPLSQSLLYFQTMLQAPHVLQVAFDLPYMDVDCFSLQEPKIVPLVTFLAQLI